MSETTAVAPEATEEKSPEQLAAEQALARASTPPTSVGGPGVQPEPAAQLPQPESGEPTGDSLHRSGLAARLAEQRHEGDAIVGVEDAYSESRDALLAGSKDEDDMEAVTEWLLSDEAEVNTRLLKVRVGGSDAKPLIVPWYIRAIGIDVIRSAEREASGANRAARRGAAAQYDELKANLRIVVEGTAALGDANGPDLKAVAKSKGLADAVTFLERKFRFRPGAIAQIAGEVMALSGFDTADVQAAGN